MRTEALDRQAAQPRGGDRASGRRDSEIERQAREKNNERANIVQQRLAVSAVVGRVVSLNKRSAVEHVRAGVIFIIGVLGGASLRRNDTAAHDVIRNIIYRWTGVTADPTPPAPPPLIAVGPTG